MPIYEYECKACGVHFDRKQGWHDEPVKQCPDCRGEVRKVMQPVGIVFKGPGFYKTDNSSSGERLARKRGEEDKPSGGDVAAKAPAGPDSQASAKTDSKPDSRPEPKVEAKAESAPGAKAETKSESRPVSNAGAKEDSKSHTRSSEASRDH
jgi:putative FmdB family regulatory protein